MSRREVVDPAQVQVFHTFQRCVRRAFLCGRDELTNRSFEHRRQWVRVRLEFLASVFGIDCLTFTVMENHLHLVLRTRPDVVAEWSDAEVAKRWLRLFPGRREKTGNPSETPSQNAINEIINQPEMLAERRRRLSDISWWMRCISEDIARRANLEDKCTGRFWEGRFRLQTILDEAGLLACAAYVDLNPIRAAIADTPESSAFTGAKERIDDLSQTNGRTETKGQVAPGTHQWERSEQCLKSGWMSPIEMDEKSDPVGPCVDDSGRRASFKGFLALPLKKYLELLDWTGRQVRSDKIGAIPKHLLPILTRIGVDSGSWCSLVETFDSVFKTAAGTPASLAREAIRRKRNWLCAPENPLGVSSA
ncbi:MAG: hypothetical protein AAF989_04740 [Planctomycetota bacterium]